MKAGVAQGHSEDRKASVTAFSVAHALARTMKRRPEVLEHFGNQTQELLHHILLTAHVQERFRWDFNGILGAIIYRLPFRIQSWFFDKLIKPGYDTMITARKLVIEAKIQAALDNKVEQIVFLGGGYDPRAFLTATQNTSVQVFEVDQGGPTRDQKLVALRTIPVQLGFAPIEITEMVSLML